MESRLDQIAGSSAEEVDRRQFLKQATEVVIGGTATAISARSYTRTLVANDRIRLGRHQRSEPRYTKPPTMGPPSDGAEILKVANAPAPDTNGGSDDDLDHIMNWLNAMRDRREPNATVDHGFSHSIACIMATQSYWSGKRVYWNPKTEEI